jgi:two-component system phosphate regulon sensor histidine kinase PhoR
MILLIVLICGAVTYWAGMKALRQQQVQDLDRLSDLIRREIAGKEISPQQAQEIVELARTLRTRITLIDASGKVLADSDHDPATMDNHNNRPEVIAARAEGRGSSVRYSDTLGEQAVYLARPLDPTSRNGLILRASYPEHIWAQFAAPLPAILIAAVISAILVMLWLGATLRRQWIRPVEDLATAAERMSAGEWGTRVEPHGADVVRFFSGRLNIVAAQAEKQLADLNHQRADLRSLVDALPDPILLTDYANRILLLNAPAAKLLQVTATQAVGKPLVTVVNEEAILRLLDDLEKSGARDETLSTVQRREIRLQRLGQRLTYQAVATRARAGGVLLVLQNVSALAATLQMKTDFVANASHELRTPIAAIKIAFETLRDVYSEDPEQTARCIKIIDGHIRRLEEMLADLLDLSHVESPDAKPVYAPVRVADLFAAMRSAMSSMAEQNDVTLRFEGVESDAFVSDVRLLQLILKNLIENGIKYTQSGGSVTARIAMDDATVRLSVNDTGIGIAPEHQSRVFERFYQIDPARSGGVGRGTGLGLAIVKHAINMLRGEVTLESTLGKGTSVTCVLSRRS